MTPWCQVSLTIKISNLTAQEKSQAKEDCSLRCSQRQNWPQSSRAKEHIPDFRNSTFSPLWPTTGQTVHPREMLCGHWPHWLGLLLQHMTSQLIWSLPTAPKAELTGSWKPTRKGTIILNITYSLCLPNAFISHRHSESTAVTQVFVKDVAKSVVSPTAWSKINDIYPSPLPGPPSCNQLCHCPPWALPCRARGPHSEAVGNLEEMYPSQPDWILKTWI